MGERTISSDEQRLARATKLAIQAAGGLEVCASDTGLSTSQLSRCSSPNERDSLSIRDAATIEAVGHGRDGHPHITRELARQAGGVFIMLPEVTAEGRCLQQSVLEIAAELGLLSRSIADALCSSGPGGAEVTPGEARMALDRLHDLEGASARMRHRLERLLSGEPADGQGTN